MNCRRKLMTPADQLDFWPAAHCRPAARQATLVAGLRSSSFWFHGEDLYRWVHARIADKQELFVLAFLDNEVLHQIGRYTPVELTRVRELLRHADATRATALSVSEDGRPGGGSAALRSPLGIYGENAVTLSKKGRA